MKYREQTLGRNLWTDVNNGVRDEELRYALSVVLQQPRPEPFLPINQRMVQQDVSDINTLALILFRYIQFISLHI